MCGGAALPSSMLYANNKLDFSALLLGPTTLLKVCIISVFRVFSNRIMACVNRAHHRRTNRGDSYLCRFLPFFYFHRSGLELQLKKKNFLFLFISFVLTLCLCLQHRILDSMPQKSSGTQETEPFLSRKGCQGSCGLFPGDGILPGGKTLVAEPVI